MEFTITEAENKTKCAFYPFYRLGDGISILSLTALLGKGLGWEPRGISELATSLA